MHILEKRQVSIATLSLNSLTIATGNISSLYSLMFYAAIYIHLSRLLVYLTITTLENYINPYFHCNTRARLNDKRAWSFDSPSFIRLVIMKVHACIIECVLYQTEKRTQVRLKYRSQLSFAGWLARRSVYTRERLDFDRSRGSAQNVCMCHFLDNRQSGSRYKERIYSVAMASEFSESAAIISPFYRESQI